MYPIRKDFSNKPRIIGDRPGGAALLTRTRRRIEKDLAHALGAPAAAVRARGREGH